jgi:hypothetical protein
MNGFPPLESVKKTISIGFENCKIQKVGTILKDKIISGRRIIGGINIRTYEQYSVI